MTTGTVISFDREEETGYIDPDDGDERIPFDMDSLEGFESGTAPRAGDRVSFAVEGGLAGFWARRVRRLEVE